MFPGERVKPRNQFSKTPNGIRSREKPKDSEEVVLSGEGDVRQGVALEDVVVVQGDFEGLGVDGDLGERVVADHVLLGEAAAPLDGDARLLEAERRADVAVFGGLGHEGDAARADGLALGGEHGPHRDGLGRRDRRVGVAHLRVGDVAALEDEVGLDAEVRRPPEHEIGEFADLDRADDVRHAVRDGGVDGVLGDVPLDALVVVRVGGVVAGEEAALPLHLVGRLPGPRDDLADAAHGLRVRRDHRDGAHVVQDVLGGDGLAADARLGERDVLGDRLVKVVAHHEHVEVLVDRIDREGPRRVRRRRQHVGLAADLDDVGRVAAAGALRVVRVDGARLHRGDRVVDEARLVERVGVDRDGDVVPLGEREARVDRRRRRAPVLVELEPARARLDDGVERRVGIRRVALAGEAKVQRVRVGRAQHHRDLRRCRRARRRARPRRGPRAAAVHRREPRRDGLVDLLRADEVDVRVDAARRQNELLARDRFGRRADHHARRVDAVHAIGVPRFADADDVAALDADVGLDDARDSVDDEGVRDDDVQRRRRRRRRALAHPFAQRLAAAELALVAIYRKIFLDRDDERRVAELDAVAGGRAERRGVLGARHRARDAARRRRALELEAERGGFVQHARLPLFGGDAVDEAVARFDDLGAADRDERDRLGVARFEANRRPGRHVEPLAIRGGAIEGQRAVRFDEMIVRSHLDRPVARVDDAQLYALAAGRQLDRARVGECRHGARSGLDVGRRVAKHGEVGHGEEAPVERQGEVAIHGAQRRMYRQQFRAIQEGPLDLDFADERRDARLDLADPEHLLARLHELGDRLAVADEFEADRRDERDGFGFVEPQPAREALLRERTELVHHEVVHLARREPHG
mmetsp:Transcript_16672/g.67230  ORF Transcript_16672/g.67230 Transcript_16672/m.67230 type:complete len:869 (-) Transcript_16672:47-2653(-)